MASKPAYFPEGYFPEGYFAPGYFPEVVVDVQPEADEGGGIWWAALPKDLQKAFGFITADPPLPKVVPEPLRVGAAYALVPMAWAKGYAEATTPLVQPPKAALAPAMVWGQVKGWLGAIWARVTGQAYPTHVGRAKGQLQAIQGHSQGQIGIVSKGDAQIPLASAVSQAEYTVAGDEEFLELVGTMLLKMDTLDVSEQEMEELLLMARLANEYFDRMEIN